MKKGFTLLEMIVAVGVFATVAVLSVSSLLSLISAQKKALALQTVQDNLRFAFESMARDIQQGRFYYCNAPTDNPPVPLAPPEGQLPATHDCTFTDGGNESITFINQNNEIVTYRNNDGTLSGSSCSLCIEKATRNTYGDSLIFAPITSRDVSITRLRIYLEGSSLDEADDTEPRITLVVEAASGAGRESTQFQLQTTVSQRTTYRQ